jgi:uncharacterized protein YdaL
VTTLATAVHNSGSTFPWAIRSQNLTYIGEEPMSYMTDTDRFYAFVDLVGDLLAPNRPAQHRALARLEDIDPSWTPSDLTGNGTLLKNQSVPFGFNVVPLFQDPNHVNGNVTSLSLAQAPAVVTALKTLQNSDGGTLVSEGYTHQFGNLNNPYDGVSGDDFEFYRAVENASGFLDYQGPVPGDSYSWALNRMTLAKNAEEAQGLGPLKIWQFPHYAASLPDYQAATAMFGLRWERALYFYGALRGTPSYTQYAGEFFPYRVKDIYGSIVLPENLGDYEPDAFNQFPPHTVQDVLNAARAASVVKDGYAAFYYHPFYGNQALSQIIAGLKAQGWTFVAPLTAATNVNGNP